MSFLVCGVSGCIPILLEKHVQNGAVLYPLQHLKFSVILLQSWANLPDRLLQLHEDMKSAPWQYVMMQEKNTKLWQQVKHAMAEKIAAEVCTSHRRTMAAPVSESSFTGNV